MKARMRITIEYDVQLISRHKFNELALEMAKIYEPKFGSLAYCATEVTTDRERSIRFEKD